jgi:hypothetical protein
MNASVRKRLEDEFKHGRSLILDSRLSGDEKRRRLQRLQETHEEKVRDFAGSYQG